MNFTKYDTKNCNLIERSCDIFIHRKEITANIYGPGIRTATLTYSVNSRSLISLRNLLFRHGISNVILHRSVFYWKLAYDILCNHFNVLVVNQRDLQECCSQGEGGPLERFGLQGDPGSGPG